MLVFTLVHVRVDSADHALHLLVARGSSIVVPVPLLDLLPLREVDGDDGGPITR